MAAKPQSAPMLIMVCVHIVCAYIVQSVLSGYSTAQYLELIKNWRVRCLIVPFLIVLLVWDVKK